MGIETEYGIVIRGGPPADSREASRLLMRHYLASGDIAVPCQSSYYSPIAPRPWTRAGNDTPQRAEVSASQPMPTYTPSPPEFAFFSYMLPNGARFYIDHSHPEYSTPECLDPRTLLAADKAGDILLDRCRQLTEAALPAGESIALYKNNSNYKGVSYGCHENYLLSAAFYEEIMYHDPQAVFKHLAPFLITRTIFTGAGKVGAENNRPATGYQLSQRADFFETLMGIQTTERRPIINTRDEPHAGPRHYRRLHTITGDANMAEYSGFLKIGTTQLVLRMLEDHFITEDMSLVEPVEAMQAVSRDRTFRRPLATKHLGHVTALDLQRRFLRYARDYLAQHGATASDQEVVDLWQQTLDDIEANATRLGRRLDWAIKLTVFDAYLGKMQTTWDEVERWHDIVHLTRGVKFDPVVADAETLRSVLSKDALAQVYRNMHASDLQWKDYAKQRKVYYDLRHIELEYHAIQMGSAPESRGIYYKLLDLNAVDRLLDDTAIALRVCEPPPDTRAWFRGRWIREFAADIINADWSQLLFYREITPYVISMPDPFAHNEHEWHDTWESINLIVSPQRHSTQADARRKKKRHGPRKSARTTSPSSAATSSRSTASTAPEPAG
jgi:proteasome accessory factor A